MTDLDPLRHTLPASAIVDEMRAPTEVGLGLYWVQVVGRSPNDYCRQYEISAKSDKLAAQEGLSRFDVEMKMLAIQRRL